jgi:hypothetical protein
MGPLPTGSPSGGSGRGRGISEPRQLQRGGWQGDGAHLRDYFFPPGGVSQRRADGGSLSVCVNPG